MQPAQLIQYNPALYVKVPKNAPKNIVERHIISSEQFVALLKKCPFGTPYYVPLLLLYHTGMRLSEMLALWWNDIDFAAKKILVQRQIVHLNKRGYFFTTLKTESSNRYIIVGDFLLGELKRWQNRQVENEKHFGGSYVYIYRENDGHIERRSKSLPAPVDEKVSLVCTREDGQLVSREDLMKMLRSAGFNALSFRHTHATILAENGAKPAGVSGRLGHKDLACTQNVYVHNTPKMQEQTAEIAGRIFQPKA